MSEDDDFAHITSRLAWLEHERRHWAREGEMARRVLPPEDEYLVPVVTDIDIPPPPPLNTTLKALWGGIGNTTNAIVFSTRCHRCGDVEAYGRTMCGVCGATAQ